MPFDVAMLAPKRCGKPMRATVTPRPVAWVTTLHADGRRGAERFSLFSRLCSEPPLLGFGITPRDGGPKETGNNICRSGEFVVNAVPHGLAASMNATAGEHGPEVGELAANALAALPSRHVAPPRIAGSPAALECRLHMVPEPGGAAPIVIGRVLALGLDDAALLEAERHHVDTPELDLIARMHGRGWYARGTDLFEIGRPEQGTTS